jgi:hypothetical protein
MLKKLRDDKRAAKAYDKRMAFQAAVFATFIRHDVDYRGWGWSVTGDIYDNLVLPKKKKRKK